MSDLISPYITFVHHLKIYLFYIMCMSVCISDCLSVCVPYVCVPGALRGGKRDWMFWVMWALGTTAQSSAKITSNPDHSATSLALISSFLVKNTHFPHTLYFVFVFLLPFSWQNRTTLFLCDASFRAQVHGET